MLAMLREGVKTIARGEGESGDDDDSDEAARSQAAIIMAKKVQRMTYGLSAWYEPLLMMMCDAELLLLWMMVEVGGL